MEMDKVTAMRAVGTTKSRPWPGIFITFEGGDGVGKSTQIRLLEERLCKEGCEVIVTREPGGSSGAEEIRKLIVEGDASRWSAMTEMLLVVAARVDHLEKTILPSLQRGCVVLCDRFTDSTMAYQGIAGEVGAKAVSAIHDLAINNITPDVTFVFSMDGQAGLRRATTRGDKEQRFESKGFEYQARVYAAFEKIAKDNARRCVLIDAEQSIEAIATEVHTIFKERWSVLKGESDG